MSPFYVGAYWGSRQESALRCGERLARCIAGIGATDEALASWFRRGASKAAAKSPVGLDEAALGKLFEKGRNRRDFGNGVIEELGFELDLWNRARPAVGLAAIGGSYSTNPGILNSFVLDFPPPEADALRLYKPSVAEAIFDAVVDAWEPDWATWTSHTLRDAQGAPLREPVVGWMTYLTPPVSADLPGARTRPLRRGSAITIGQDVNGAGEEVVLDVRARLGHIGALHPIP